MEKTVTVLITGAAGFIGRHVAAEYAKQGKQVIGMGRGDWGDWRSYGISEWHSGELTLNALIEWGGAPDVIVHCAGGAAVGFSVENPAVDFDLTVRLTSDVLEYIRVHTPSTRLVYLSSAAVYGHIKTLPISEEAALNPISPYGLHKKMAEELCQLYARQFGLSVATVRLFSIYGAGLRKQLLWDACRKFEQGENVFFGTGEEVRDWLHVEDVAKLLIKAAENATEQCPIVNAGTGQGVMVKDVLQRIGEAMGGLKPQFSSQPKAGDPNAYIADISKALSWEWEPKINWRDGVLAYVEWYKQCL